MKVQALLAIPNSEALRNYGEPNDVLMRQVAGVPLLVRVLATAARSGADSVLVIWPEGVNRSILDPYVGSPLFKGMRVDALVSSRAFDPRNMAHWAEILPRIEDTVLWLPWNAVTHKRALSVLSSAPVRPVSWKLPALLEKQALLPEARLRVAANQHASGVTVTTAESASVAERFLVVNSGKATDGIYSNFNRRLCWPAVRILSRTPVTPNGLTLAGLLVAIGGALLFARGSYVYYVAGALLFFVSGLFDEMDGMIARIKFRESAFGTWFEGFVDNVTYLAVFAGIIVGLYREYGSWALKWGVALILGCVLSVGVIAMQRKLATSRERPHEYAGKMNQLMDADSSNLISKVVRQVHIFVKKGVLVHYLLLFTLLGRLHMFLWLAALGSNITWILALYFTRRFFSRPPLAAAGKQIHTAA
jgi:phosphatidylglycerophosphate synthase